MTPDTESNCYSTLENMSRPSGNTMMLPIHEVAWDLPSFHGVSSQAEEFHPFQHLPAEIRCMIVSFRDGVFPPPRSSPLFVLNRRAIFYVGPSSIFCLLQGNRYDSTSAADISVISGELHLLPADFHQNSSRPRQHDIALSAFLRLSRPPPESIERHESKPCGCIARLTIG